MEHACGMEPLWNEEGALVEWRLRRMRNVHSWNGIYLCGIDSEFLSGFVLC